MFLDSNVWGPHYWFMLHTIALGYPTTPTESCKKKYYEFISNLPLFIPDRKMSNNFINMLNEYPLSPYLDSRESFVKWINFIHNKINGLLGKPQFSVEESAEKYKSNYTIVYPINKRKINIKFILELILLALIIQCCISVYNMSNYYE